MADESNPFLITPPPGLLPAVPEKKPVDRAASTDTEVPVLTVPGITGDSVTVRVSAPREPVTARPPMVSGIPFTTPPQAPTADADEETRVVRPAAMSTASWWLTLPDGQNLTVGSAVFLGRNPIRTSDDRTGELLPLADDTKSVSKTHALLETNAEGLWVTDLDSTNGVYVAYADGTGVQAEPGVAVSVLAGSDIVLGEYVIQIERH